MICSDIFVLEKEEIIVGMNRERKWDLCLYG